LRSSYQTSRPPEERRGAPPSGATRDEAGEMGRPLRESKRAPRLVPICGKGSSSKGAGAEHGPESVGHSFALVLTDASVSSRVGVAAIPRGKDLTPPRPPPRHSPDPGASCWFWKRVGLLGSIWAQLLLAATPRITFARSQCRPCGFKRRVARLWRTPLRFPPPHSRVTHLTAILFFFFGHRCSAWRS